MYIKIISNISVNLVAYLYLDFLCKSFKSTVKVTMKLKLTFLYGMQYLLYIIFLCSSLF